MSFEELVSKVGVYAGSFVVGFVSGLIPVFNSEVFLVAVSPIVARHSLVSIALLSTIGQMTAKTIIFYAGRGVVRIDMGKFERKLESVQKKFREWEGKVDALILLSAIVGLPPLYLVSFVAGAAKIHFARFLAAGFTGRFIRFMVVVYSPQLVLKYL
jgi:membrane protein YqaA with SNARE-associated domain